MDKLQVHLEKRAHWAPPDKRKGAPRVYAFAGTMKQLKASPDKCPLCPAFYATRDTFGRITPDPNAEALVQWLLHGEHAPEPGDQFYAFSTHHHDWIGAGTCYREKAGTMALLERGSFANFARFEDDARGLILVFTTGTILR
ncbi:MAG TPA: hypothetical protein VJ952_09755 [Opitutales bacterium]|nr:hypothetical protein [Opitutales bacterium]